MKGRPLWFLGTTVAGWTMVRIAMLWPEAVAAVSAMPVADRPAAIIVPGAAVAAAATAPFVPALTSDDGRGPVREVASVGSAPPAGRTRSAARPEPGLSAAANAPEPGHLLDPGAAADLVMVPGLPPLPQTRLHSRWSGSAWAIARDGGAGALLSPLLGGSQAGVRLAYALDGSGRTAVYGRAAAPLGRGPAELVLGGQWRPRHGPVTLFAEARGSDGRIAPVAGLFGGGARALGRFRLDGYGQAGVIVRDGASAFGDGQIRLTRTFGPVEAGAGLWGAVQRGARRLDVGPSVALPVAAKPLSLRVMIDWRQRVAGNARPASGPALSLGADF